MLRIGIIGCGAIGTTVAARIDEGLPGIELVAVSDSNPAAADQLRSALKTQPEIASIVQVAKQSDVCLEATSAASAPAVIRAVLSQDSSALVLTVGALINEPSLIKLANSAGRRIYIPSGAVAGLDWIQAAAIGRLDKITLTTRKPPASLAGAPGFDEPADPASLQGEKIVFVGSVEEAVAKFPANINVAALLALAAHSEPDLRQRTDWSKIQVRVVADPTISQNVHELEAAGQVGRLKVRIENEPSPLNPRSSMIAAFSAVATLRKIAAPVRAGT